MYLSCLFLPKSNEKCVTVILRYIGMVVTKKINAVVYALGLFHIIISYVGEITYNCIGLLKSDSCKVRSVKIRLVSSLILTDLYNCT